MVRRPPITLKSEKTFEEEHDSFRDIERIFWEAEDEYPSDPFSGILEELEDEQRVVPDYFQPEPAAVHSARKQPVDIRPLGQTRLLRLSRGHSVDSIGKAAAGSDAQFADSFWDLLGIDVQEELERLAGENLPADEAALQALTAKFGTDAFGTYCPWHAFGNSTETPWGIYMFPEKLFEWAGALHRSGLFLPDPKPPILKVLQLLWLLTYRHELFHFHVELYATRIESSLRRPIYRPYVERVRALVANTSEWWEEALAQAVVLKSTMVMRKLGIDLKYMKAYVVPYFRTFPEGYKQFECKSVGGEHLAHRILSAQIARAQVSIHERERNTGLSVAKDEYRASHKSVPGYFVFRPEFISRFQLQTPRLRDVERYIRSVGKLDEHAPGDHKRAKVNGQVVQLNRAKHGDAIDLASAKALAGALGIRVFDLIRVIG